MFKHIISYDNYMVTLSDSEFTDTVKTYGFMVGGCYFIPEIIAIYSRRKLNVADALARYVFKSYRTQTAHKMLLSLNALREQASHYTVTEPYVKYHKCVLNKIKILQWQANLK